MTTPKAKLAGVSLIAALYAGVILGLTAPSGAGLPFLPGAGRAGGGGSLQYLNGCGSAHHRSAIVTSTRFNGSSAVWLPRARTSIRVLRTPLSIR